MIISFFPVHNYQCSGGKPSTTLNPSKMQTTMPNNNQMETTKETKTTKDPQPTQSNPSKCDKCVPSYYCNGKVDRTVQSPFDMTKYFSCKNGIAGDCSTCSGKSVYVEVCGRCMMFDPRKWI